VTKTPRPRRRLAFVVAGLLLGAIAVSGWIVHRQRQLDFVRSSLPALPARAQNASLLQRLTTAREQAQSGDLAAVATLGRLCHANGFATEAAACWRILAEAQPHEGRWPYYLADLSRTAGDQSAAERALEQCVAADSSAATAWLQLAEMKFKTGRTDAAEAAYRRRLALLPGDPYARLGLARIAGLRGHPDESLGLLETVLRDHPKFSAAHNLYAELQAAAGREDLADLHRWLGRDAGRFREADDPWMDEVNAECLDARRLSHLGTIAYQTGRGDLGRAQFERAIELEPGDPLAYQLLGELLFEKKDATRAREVLERGLAKASVAPPAPTHFVKLSEVWIALERPDEAQVVLLAGLERHPDAAELQLAWGNWLVGAGDNDAAIAAFRRALSLNPGLVEADFSLSNVLLRQGRREEAMAALEHAHEMQPTFPKGSLALAGLEMGAGHMAKAGEYLLPLLKANPGVPEVRWIVARWRYTSGRQLEKSDPAAAEQHYRAGLKLVSDDPALNGALGMLLLRSGRVAESVAPLEIFQRAQPDNAEAALALGQAYFRTGRVANARKVLAAGLDRAEQGGQTATASHFREILSALPP